MAAVLADLRSRRDPVAVNRLADWAVAHVKLDAALDRAELVRLARAALALEPADGSGSTLPVEQAPGLPGRLVADPEAAPAAVRAFREGRPVLPRRPRDQRARDPLVAPC